MNTGRNVDVDALMNTGRNVYEQWVDSENQIRSHAQKYFLKVQKSGTKEHVPPPKRKAAYAYPHKAPKNVGGISQSTASLIKYEDIVTRDSCLWPTNQCSTADDVRSSGAAILHNCCSSSIDSGPGIWSAGETNNQQEVKQRAAGRVMPDFPKVYRFIGGIFDPNESNHWQKLKTMDPVDFLKFFLMFLDFLNHRSTSAFALLHVLCN